MSLEWTQSEDAILKTYAEQGRSSGEVMQALRGRTRNAVLGRADRLKVTFKGYGGHNNQNISVKKLKSEKRISIPPHQPFMLPDDEPSQASISALQARDFHCAWILGDPKNLRRCSNHAAKDCAWCVYHMQRVFADIKQVQTVSAGIPK